MGVEVISKSVICTITFKENSSISCDLQLNENFENGERSWSRIKNVKNLQFGDNNGDWTISTVKHESYLYSILWIVKQFDGVNYYFQLHWKYEDESPLARAIRNVPPAVLEGNGYMHFPPKEIVYRIWSPK